MSVEINYWKKKLNLIEWKKKPKKIFYKKKIINLNGFKMER